MNKKIILLICVSLAHCHGTTPAQKTIREKHQIFYDELTKYQYETFDYYQTHKNINNKEQERNRAVNKLHQNTTKLNEAFDELNPNPYHIIQQEKFNNAIDCLQLVAEDQKNYVFQQKQYLYLIFKDEALCLMRDAISGYEIQLPPLEYAQYFLKAKHRLIEKDRCQKYDPICHEINKQVYNELNDILKKIDAKIQEN